MAVINGVVTKAEQGHSGDTNIGLDPSDGNGVKNPTNFGYTMVGGNPDDLHEGDHVTITIAKVV